MKIVYKDNVSVQQKDLKLLLKARKIEDIPSNVLESLKDIYKNDNQGNPTDFVVYSGEETVKFFDSLDYILDYTNFNNLSWADTLDMSRIALKELNEAFKKYDALNDSSTEEEILNATNRLDLMRYKVESVKSLIDAKKANITISSIDNPKEGRFKKIAKSFYNHKKRR